MNNILDFVIKIQDMGSGAVQKFASSAQRVFGKVEQSVANTERRMRSFGSSVNGLNTKLQELTQRRDISLNMADVRRANREIAALERQINRLQTAGVNTGGSGGGGARLPYWMTTAAVGAMAMAGTMGVMKAGARAQQDIIGLSTFVGAKQAQTVYAQIQKDAAATPFGTKGLLSADRALISAGVAADKARLDVLGLANAIAATGGGDDELARMAQNMQQIKNAGEATAADVKQFGFAGINIYQLLASATGKTVKQAKDLTVTYDLLSFALRKAAADGGLYAGAMEAQGKSISGKWSTLLDNLDNAFAKIGLSQSNAITGLIDQLIGITNSLPALAEQWTASITGMVKGVISFVGMLVSMAKWLYRNWTWLKYIVGAMAMFYSAMKIAGVVASVYNTLMTVAAAKTALFAAASTEAAAAAWTLNTAMLATPWGMIALGVAGVTAALIAMNSVASKQKEIKVANAIAMRNEEYNNRVRRTIYDLQNDPVEKMSPGKFFSRQQNEFYGTAFQSILEERLAAKPAEYQKRMMSHIKDIYSDLLNAPNTLELVTLKNDPNNLTSAYAEKVKKILEFLSVEENKYYNTPKKGAASSTDNLYKGAIEDTGKNITGGGGKTVNINIRNVVGTMTNNVADGTGLIENIKTDLETVMARVLARTV